MYSTIIVPIDPDDYATTEFGPALRLAQTLGAEIVLVGEPDVVEHHRVVFGARAPVTQNYLAANEAPAAAITHVVERRGAGACLVVVATHAKGRIGYAFGGSTAEDIVRASHANVLLLGPECDPMWQPGAGPVAVSLDESHLAEQALPLARGWAAAFGSQVQVIQVTTPAPSVTAIPAPVTGYAVDPFTGVSTTAVIAPAPSRAREFAHPAQTYLDGQVNLLRAQGIEAHGYPRVGHRAATIITTHLSENNNNLAIMTSHGRSGVGRVILGSTTIAVARHAPCPVLTTAPALDKAEQEGLALSLSRSL